MLCHGPSPPFSQGLPRLPLPAPVHLALLPMDLHSNAGAGPWLGHGVQVGLCNDASRASTGALVEREAQGRFALVNGGLEIMIGWGVVVVAVFLNDGDSIIFIP